jgi:hypothetical protein
MPERIACLLAQELHPFGVNCHWGDYISSINRRAGMDHQEKIQMLNEIQEIRALILELSQPTGIGTENRRTETSGVNVPASKGKRVLDLF